MEYLVEFKKSVLKDLNKLSKDSVERIISKIENDLPKETAHQKPLKGEFKGLRKYRVGNYRIIFTIIGNRILILRITDRKDVYKKPF